MSGNKMDSMLEPFTVSYGTKTENEVAERSAHLSWKHCQAIYGQMK